jgi:hypothetical protein
MGSKGKMKLCQYMAWRHTGAEEIQICSFLSLALGGGEVRLALSALLLRKRPLVCTEFEVGGDAGDGLDVLGEGWISFSCQQF